MAVEMAKLSLWLVPLQKDRPFTFLDHVFKCGDSLLGVSDLKQIQQFSLRAGHIQHTFGTINLFRYVEEAAENRRRLEALPSETHQQLIEKERLHTEAEAATVKVKVLADCLVALELEGLDGERYDEQRTSAADRAEVAMRKSLPEFEAYAHEQLHRRRTFHWPVEFPEVFERGGFDAFVGNPPFLGGKKISGELGNDYRKFLVGLLARGRSGVADLCAFFFLRVVDLLNVTGGMAGLIATNTIAQGDTREVGLSQILSNDAVITRAVASRPWPGEAALEVAHIWLRRGSWAGRCSLNDRVVVGVTAFLTEPRESTGTPFKLAANANKSFQGSILLGMGFSLSPEKATELLTLEPRNRDVIFPYINGEDLNSRPDQSPSRFVINFREWPADRSAQGSWAGASEEVRKAWLRTGSVPFDYPDKVAADYPDCFEIVKRTVKPERDLVKRAIYRERWWNYAERQTSLYQAVARMPRVLAAAQTSKYTSISIIPASLIFSNTVIVILFADDGTFGLLSSSIHSTWVAEYASSLETRLRYVPTDCLENFPFPTEIVCLEKIVGKLS